MDIDTYMSRIVTHARRRMWRILKPLPYSINLTKLIKNGCLFEVTTPLEEARIASLDNEEEFLRLLLRSVRQGDVFFDIGACLGLFAIHAALVGANVVGFEPEPNYRVRLNRNINLNGLTQYIRVEEWAVSDREGEVFLYTNGINGKSPSLCQVGDRETVKVVTNSIDNAIFHNNLPIPSILKIDIEGAEILALKGMQRLLQSKDRPRSIFIEIHPDLLTNFRSSEEECLNIFKTSGYTMKYSNIRDGQIHYIFSV